jgi:hypothetical protein
VSPSTYQNGPTLDAQNPGSWVAGIFSMSNLFKQARGAHEALRTFMLNRGGRGTRESNDFLEGLLVDALRNEMARIHKPQASFELLGSVWSEEFGRFERLYVGQLERIEMFRKDFESSMRAFENKWIRSSGDLDSGSFTQAVDEIQRAARTLAGPGYQVISVLVDGLEFRPRDLAELTLEDAYSWLFNWVSDSPSSNPRFAKVCRAPLTIAKR